MTVQDAPSPKAVRDAHPPGAPCWIDAARGDPRATAGFYAGLFGWTFEDLLPETDPGCYLVARLPDGGVAAIASGLEGDPAWSPHVCVEDVDAAAARVVAAGGDVLAGPVPLGDDGWMAPVVDATGATLVLWEPRTAGAGAVNAPGPWTWGTLRTRDPERAIAFYAEAFGWDAVTVDPGAGTPATLLTLPGGGERPASRGRRRRGRRVAGGVRPGVADAVAGLEPMPRVRWGDRVPSHWSLTFAVADVDAMAARAAAVGGRVVRVPVWLGPARLATLADPAGVVFGITGCAAAG